MTNNLINKDKVDNNTDEKVKNEKNYRNENKSTKRRGNNTRKNVLTSKNNEEVEKRDVPNVEKFKSNISK